MRTKTGGYAPDPETAPKNPVPPPDAHSNIQRADPGIMRGSPWAQQADRDHAELVSLRQAYAALLNALAKCDVLPTGGPVGTLEALIADRDRWKKLAIAHGAPIMVSGRIVRVSDDTP